MAPALISAVILGTWFVPPPDGLTVQAWRLFALFAGAIVFVVANALPILTASVIAVAAAVLTGLLSPAKAYAGFANGTILLIVLAFLVARSVVKCGLGARIGHLLVSRFGRSTLGLSYSIFLVDGLIAPAFPSNTARSGVIFPLAFSLADAPGAKPGDQSRRRLGLKQTQCILCLRDITSRCGHLRGGGIEQLFCLVNIQRRHGPAIMAQIGESKAVLRDVARLPANVEFKILLAKLKVTAHHLRDERHSDGLPCFLGRKILGAGGFREAAQAPEHSGLPGKTQAQLRIRGP